MEINKKLLSGLSRSPILKKVKPMLATLIQRPFDDAKFIFEIKWDGYRMISSLNEGAVEITSRNLNSYTAKFPSIIRSLKKIKKNVILDGEIVALDNDGNSNFQLLQNFQKSGKGNIAYYLFDILWYEGYDIEKLPLIERKKIQESIIPKSDDLFFSEHIEKYGKKLFSLIEKKKLEGIIAKEIGSKYYEGVRSKQWLKIKTEKTQEAIICGYTEPRRSRIYIGSLILGIYENNMLTYIGHTGTGMNESDLKELFDLFQKYVHKKSPFITPPKTNAPVTWLKPKLICEVKFSNWTTEGIMRHPVFTGLRKDKEIFEVIREQ